ncbi:MAG: energy-converting Ni,Fe-hydrogenase subunit HyfG [Chloroflexi bacterium]|nr:energy-converting Ni,Fe-hydrogenase subunit HyfG [Chloroflexota bacterium]
MQGPVSSQARSELRWRLRGLLGPYQANVSGSGTRFSAKVPVEHLRAACVAVAGMGAPLLTMIATDDRLADRSYGLHYVFSYPAEETLIDVNCAVPAASPSYPSVTRALPAAAWYEREARDMFGIVADDHPDPRRLVLHDDWPRGYHPLRKDVDGHLSPDLVPERAFPFSPVKGEGVTEVPVGPIHAGIIEPGHFRFGVVGEQIVHLEARLFYVHRGIEKLCEGLPLERALEIVERICGVCTLAHSVAFCQAIESLGEPNGSATVPPRALALRSALLELERLYNHVGDVGNICAGVSLAAGAMAGARLKDDLQRLAERMTGSRYLRGMCRPGGLRLDLDAATCADFAATIERVSADFKTLELLLLGTDSLMRRLDATGVLPRQAAQDLGAVGVAARASGIGRDIRLDHPYAAYRTHAPVLVTETSGDVAARFHVRLREAHESIRLIVEILAALPSGDTWAPVTAPEAGSHGIGWAESPRGEHVHWLRVGQGGVVDRLRVRAASYCNWPVVPLTVPGNMVPDFPLINKSFELCYSCLDR